MNGAVFIKTVRLNALKNFIFHFAPVTAAVWCLILFLLYTIPFGTIFNPEKLSASDTYYGLKKGNYITVTYEKLYYTGYDIRSGNSSKGSYYYGIYDGRCVFIIIDTKNLNPPPAELENYTSRCRVISRNALYNTMLSSFHADIDWTLEGLTGISADYILSEPDFHAFRYYILFYVIIAVTVLSIWTVMINILYILLPASFHPCFRKLRRIAGSKEVFISYIEAISEEFSLPAEFTRGSIIITHSFFMEVAAGNITVLPLDHIIWIYSFQHLKKFFLFKNLYSSIYFVTRKGIKAHINKKSAEDTREMFDYFIACHPHILLKYSAYNRKKAGEIIKTYE